jgi:hypothetical protein
VKAIFTAGGSSKTYMTKKIKLQIIQQGSNIWEFHGTGGRAV